MASDKSATPELHELVYGSAQKLLAAGGSDLGVIASTRDFPSDAARQLTSHRSYALQSGQATAGIDTLPVKYIAGTLGRFLEFTRIEMGIDHTGRFIPFAHHCLVEQSAVRESEISLGDALLGLAQVSRPPAGVAANWIEPRRILKPAAPTRKQRLSAEILAAAADTIVQYPSIKRPVVILAGAADGGRDNQAECLVVLAAIADLLPRDGMAAFVAVTHVVSKDDRVDEASVLCTYPGSAFHQDVQGRTGSRKPLIIDLAAAKANPLPEVTPFARVTRNAITAGVPSSFAVLCDRLNAKPPQYEAVAAIAEAIIRLTSQPTLTNLESFCTQIVSVKGLPDSSAVDKIADETFKELWSTNAVMLIAEAGRLPDGGARLASMASSCDSFAYRLARVGIALHSKQRASQSEIISFALRAIGQQGLEMAERAAQSTSDRNAARAFLRQVVGEPETPSGSRAAGAHGMATPPLRKPPPPKTQHRGATVAGSLPADNRCRSEHSNLRQPDYSAAASLGVMDWVLIVLSLIPITIPIWRELNLPHNWQPTPTSQSPADGKEPESPAAHPGENNTNDNRPRPLRMAWIGMEHFVPAVERSQKFILAPAIFFLAAVALIALRGPVTQASFEKLSPRLGETLAAWLPRLVVISICLMSWWWTLYYGYTKRGPPENPVAGQAAKSPAAEKGNASPGKPGGGR
jgi:hypothetical protein